MIFKKLECRICYLNIGMISHNVCKPLWQKIADKEGMPYIKAESDSNCQISETGRRPDCPLMDGEDIEKMYQMEAAKLVGTVIDYLGKELVKLGRK